MCIQQCCHYSISEDLIAQAEEEEALLAEQKGEVTIPTTIGLSDRFHFWGSLAQNGTFEYIRSLGITVDHESPYFSPDISHDEYDFMHRGKKVDVKGSPSKSDQVYPGSRFFVRYDSPPQMHYYLFVKIDLENRIFHFPGIITRADMFGQLGKFETEGVKYPCRITEARNLSPLRNFRLWGVTAELACTQSE